jgi:hypothetical protein
LAGIPVRRDMFEYAGGGIIAFANGGDTMGTPSLEQQELASQAASITDEMVAERRNKAKLIAELEQKLAFLTNAGAPQAAEVRAQLEALKGPEAPRAAPSAPPAARQTPPPQAGAKLDSGLPLAAQQKSGAQKTTASPMPGGQRPAAQAPAADLPAALAAMQAPKAAAIPVSPDRAEVETLMQEQKRSAPTAQGIISDVNALMPAGMQEAAQQKLFADQRARAEERRATFEKTRPSGLDDLIRVFGQAGQYKGLSGTGPAYTANQDRKRAQELAFQKEQDTLLTAIEGRSTAADKGVFEARTGAMDKAQSLFGQNQKSILEAATKKLETSQGRIDSEAKLNMQRDLKLFEMAQEERLKGMDLEQRERERKTTAANNPAAQAAQFVALKQRARDLRENGQKAAADKLDAQAADMIAFKSGSGTAAVGAENSQTRMLREALKDVNSRLEFMDPKDPEYKALSDQSKTLSKRVVDRALKDAGESGGKNEGTPLPENASAKNLVVGTVYQTAKGPAKWTGTGFMPI